MSTKQYNYPNYFDYEKVYLVRFQTDESDNTIDCWMNGFPNPFEKSRLPIYKAAQYDASDAKQIKDWMLKDVFVGDGILSIVPYSDAAKIDSELREMAANCEKESNKNIGDNQSQINTTQTKEPVCPYCGYVDLEPLELPFVWDIPSETLNETITTVCEECFEKYQVERIAHISYSTLKLNNQPVIQND